MRSSERWWHTIVPIPGNCSFHQTLPFLCFISEHKPQSRPQTAAAAAEARVLYKDEVGRAFASVWCFSPACAMRMKLIFILSVSFCAAQGSELGVRDEGEQNGHCSDPSPFSLLYVKLFFSHLQLTEWTLVGAVTSDLRTLEIFHHGAVSKICCYIIMKLCCLITHGEETFYVLLIKRMNLDPNWEVKFQMQIKMLKARNNLNVCVIQSANPQHRGQRDKTGRWWADSRVQQL